MLLSSLLIMNSIPVKAVPNPIYGQAIKSDGSSADGAYVLVTDSNGTSVHTFVGSDGGWSSGWWQVDIGDPGVYWVDNTSFTVRIQINGTDWYTTSTGTVSSNGINMSTITLTYHGSGPSPPVPPVPVPPVADAGGPYSTLVDEILQFDGSGSYDPDGTITNYTWFIDELTTLYGEKPKYIFKNAGNYSISLTVTDNDGLTNTNTTTAEIKELPPDVHHPVPVINGPFSAIINETILIDGSESYDPDGGYITNYTWTLGDNTTAFGESVFYQYTSIGTYIVTLYVVDNSNLTNSTTTTATIYQGKNVEELNGDLIDTNGSGTYDEYLNKTTGVITKTKELENGSYLIDDQNDGKWHWIYNPVTGNLSPYHEPPSPPKPGFPLWAIITIIIVIAIIIILLILFKFDILYFE